MRQTFMTAVFAATILATPAAAQNLTMLSGWDESYEAVPVFAQGFIERVAEKSGGEFTIQLRGPETVPPFEQLQPVSAGLFDMLFTHGAYHLGETSMAFGMDAIEDDPAARRESGIYDLIDEHYAKHNLKLIGVFSAASGYHILLRQPIGQDGGLQGLRVRASATYHDFITALNGSVVTLPASDIYSSLDRGVVDGAAWPVFGAMDYRWYEVANHMTRPTFGINNHSIFMNLNAWNNLTEEQQALLTEVAIELEVEGRAEFEALFEEENEAMVEAGLAVTEFGPEYADRVEAIFAEGVWRQVLAHSGGDGEAFQALAIERGLTAQ